MRQYGNLVFPMRALLVITIAMVVTGCIWNPEEGEDEVQFESGIWQGNEVEYVKGQIVVALADGVEPQDVADLFDKLHLTMVKDFDVLRTALVDIPEPADLMETIAQLNESPLIRYAEPNMVMTTQKQATEGDG